MSLLEAKKQLYIWQKSHGNAINNGFSDTVIAYRNTKVQYYQKLVTRLWLEGYGLS